MLLRGPLEGFIPPIALTVAGASIILAGVLLHIFTPASYGAYYRVPLATKTILPGLAYGTTLLLVGLGYARVQRRSGLALISALLLTWNAGYLLATVNYLTTPYGMELAFEIYFFICQTLTYPWLISNVTSLLFIQSYFKRKKFMQ